MSAPTQRDTRSLAAIMLANRPGLAEHLAEQEAQMRAPRRATNRRPRKVDLSTRTGGPANEE